ncbi:MAG: hypothetical protein QXO75_06745, partial [Nitrososphaerota archaeon]
GEPYKSKLEPYRKMSFEKAEKVAPPFYWLFNVQHTLAPYKVAWKEVSARMKVGGFHVAVLEPAYDKYSGSKIVVPEHTVVLIPLDNKNEAHYLAAILNSSPVALYGAYMPVKGLENIRIPRFDTNNATHQTLSRLSKEAHKIAKQIHEENRSDLIENLQKIEDEIDKCVAELYEITDNELEEIKECLIILKEGGFQEEEEVEEEEVLPKEERIKISLEPLLINEDQSQEIDVKLTNDFNSDIENLSLKISLKDKTIVSEKVEKIEKGGGRGLKFFCPSLKAGQYSLKIELTFSINGERRKVEEERMLFVKAISKKMPTAFGDLDKLFGD